MKYEYQIGGQTVLVSVERREEGLQVTVGARVYTVAASQAGPGVLRLDIDGRRTVAYVVADGTRRYVAVDGETWIVEEAERERRRAGASHMPGGALTATMPGQVLDVAVAQGDVVERGATLVVLEAMKMELRIQAPRAGRIGSIHCRAGQVVERGQVLVEMAEEKE